MSWALIEYHGANDVCYDHDENVEVVYIDWDAVNNSESYGLDMKNVIRQSSLPAYERRRLIDILDEYWPDPAPGLIFDHNQEDID